MNARNTFIVGAALLAWAVHRYRKAEKVAQQKAMQNISAAMAGRM